VPWSADAVRWDTGYSLQVRRRAWKPDTYVRLSRTARGIWRMSEALLEVDQRHRLFSVVVLCSSLHATSHYTRQRSYNALLGQIKQWVSLRSGLVKAVEYQWNSANSPGVLYTVQNQMPEMIVEKGFMQLRLGIKRARRDKPTALTVAVGKRCDMKAARYSSSPTMR
jgi:hypothetical protein